MRQGAPPVAMQAPETPVAATGGTLPGSPIRLGDGEVLWRKYQAVQLNPRRRGEGTLYVTDARVVFFARAQGRGTQRGSALVQQTKLEDITGLAAFVSHRVNLGLLALTGLLGLFTLGAVAASSWAWALIWGILTGVCVAVLLGSGAKRGSTGVIINSRATQTSPISFGNFQGKSGLASAIMRFLIFPVLVFFRAYTAFDVIVGAPGEDSDRIIAELGALILDLQTRGAFAGEHWGVGGDRGTAQSRGVT
ncbi:MAG TPA: hypothetical protein VIV12_19995 [Streptosporangiaceae bacterium]